jgi:hypothetical protein
MSQVYRNLVHTLLAQNKHCYNSNKFDKCGVYQLTCSDCTKKYIGQTDRPFHIRFHEHFREYKYGNNKSKFAQLLDNKHSTGNMENIMDILYITSKGKMLNTLEKFHIYKETKVVVNF